MGDLRVAGPVVVAVPAERDAPTELHPVRVVVKDWGVSTELPWRAHGPASGARS